MSDDKPILVEWSDLRVEGEPGRRLMVVLNAPGCEYARQNDGGCTNCSFPHKMAAKRAVSTDDLVRQLETALMTVPSMTDKPLEIDIYNSGSFFNPNEIPKDAQNRILKRLATVPGLRRVLLESRPEYVHPAVLTDTVRALPGIALAVGIGLESANDEIRERRIKKGFTLHDFERAAKNLAAVGAELLVYVLVKPIDTSESEAIEDAVFTVETVFNLGKTLKLPVRVALEPCFVGPGTKLQAAYETGKFRPPRLWSVLEVVRRTASLGTIVIGLSDEGLAPDEIAHNCSLCTKTVRRALADFNETGQVESVTGLSCECLGEWRSSLMS